MWHRKLENSEAIFNFSVPPPSLCLEELPVLRRLKRIFTYTCYCSTFRNETLPSLGAFVKMMTAWDMSPAFLSREFELAMSASYLQLICMVGLDLMAERMNPPSPSIVLFLPPLGSHICCVLVWYEHCFLEGFFHSLG